MKTFFKKITDTIKEREARQKALRDSMTTKQKLAEVLIAAVAILVVALGFAFHATITGVLLGFALLTLLSLPYNRRIRVKDVVAWAATPALILFVISAGLGHMAYSQVGDLTARNAQVIVEQRDALKKDAQDFLHDMQNKRLAVLDMVSTDEFLTKNDPLLGPIMRSGFAVGVFGRGSVDDLNAAFPIIDIVTSKDMVYLTSLSVMSNLRERTKDLIASHPELDPNDDKAVAELLSESNAHRGIMLITCTMTKDGAVTGITSLSGAPFSELIDTPEAAPLIEVCQSFAPGRERPQTLTTEAFWEEGRKAFESEES
ncbi:MAG: hypothetical protein ABJN42_10500 [Roseibium sp.]|uniref:hypothetical protein n=1 Tax=Roseibium sp. TaxID=1936156 RepID=UPI0032991BDE